jgi:hypothetical protein
MNYPKQLSREQADEIVNTRHKDLASDMGEGPSLDGDYEQTPEGHVYGLDDGTTIVVQHNRVSYITGGKATELLNKFDRQLPGLHNDDVWYLVVSGLKTEDLEEKGLHKTSVQDLTSKLFFNLQQAHEYMEQWAAARQREEDAVLFADDEHDLLIAKNPETKLERFWYLLPIRVANR